MLPTFDSICQHQALVFSSFRQAVQIGHRKLIFYWSRKVVYSPCYCLLSGPFVKMFVKVNAKQICLWEQIKLLGSNYLTFIKKTKLNAYHSGWRIRIEKRCLFFSVFWWILLLISQYFLPAESLRYIKVTAQQETVFHIGMHYWCLSSAHFLDSCLLKSLYL